MKKAGLLEYPGRGLFKLTERGSAALKKDGAVINNRYLQQFPEFLEFKAKKVDRHGAVPLDTQVLDPEEAIETAYQSVRAAVEDDLLGRLKTAPPDFFERLVVDLLLKMGYGGSRKEAGRAIGKSGDEGIDGVIDEDLLGLDVVYVQAKRWSDQSVSRQHIQ